MLIWENLGPGGKETSEQSFWWVMDGSDYTKLKEFCLKRKPRQS